MVERSQLRGYLGRWVTLYRRAREQQHLLRHVLRAQQLRTASRGWTKLLSFGRRGATREAIDRETGALRGCVARALVRAVTRRRERGAFDAWRAAAAQRRRFGVLCALTATRRAAVARGALRALWATWRHRASRSAAARVRLVQAVDSVGRRLRRNRLGGSFAALKRAAAERAEAELHARLDRLVRGGEGHALHVESLQRAAARSEEELAAHRAAQASALHARASNEGELATALNELIVLRESERKLRARVERAAAEETALAAALAEAKWQRSLAAKKCESATRLVAALQEEKARLGGALDEAERSAARDAATKTVHDRDTALETVRSLSLSPVLPLSHSPVLAPHSLGRRVDPHSPTHPPLFSALRSVEGTD